MSQTTKTLLANKGRNLVHALNTTPGTLADDIGCLIALSALAAAAYVLLGMA